MHHHAALMTAFLSNFCDYLLMTSIIPLFPILGYSDVATGFLFSIKAIVQIIAAPLFSRIIDSHPIQLLIVGLLADVFATLAFAFHVDYDTWFAARAIQGLAAAAILPASNALVQRSFRGNESERVKAFGISTGGILAGVVLGPPVGGGLFSLHPALPFVSMTVLLLISVGGAFHVLTHMDLPQLDEDVVNSGPLKLWEFMRDGHVRRSMGALFIANAGISALEATFGSYGFAHLGLSVSDVGLMYLWTTIPSISASMTGVNILHSKLGLRKSKVIALGLVTQGLFFMMGPKTAVINKISFVGLGVGMGLIDGMTPSLNAQLADARHKGSTAVHSFSTMAIQGGFIAGPIIGSYISSLFGFWGMSLILGGAMVVYAPFMEKLAHWEETHVEEENSPLLSK